MLTGKNKFMKNPKIWKNYYDIVILPQKEVSDYAIKLSRQLHKYGTPWVLGKKSFIPHISLYHIPVKPKDFNGFINEVKMIAREFKPGKLKIEKLGLWKSYRSVCIDTDKPEWIRKLYLKVIKKTLKYFDWDCGAEKTWGSAKLKLMKKNIKQYGTPMVGRYFMPHVTLAVFRDDKNMVKASNELQLRKFRFEAKSIFICELGESHSCQRIVKQINF